MSYDQIHHLKVDKEPLRHWEKILGMLSTMDGEILKYILCTKISLKKKLRLELGSRVNDENHRRFGYEKTAGIWLK
jgi:hypothetical protein